jgi:hypothetical protein
VVLLRCVFMRASAVTPLYALLLILASAGCSTERMTVEQKYEHLREVANRGADAHYVLINENKPATREVCAEHYRVFVPEGAPSENRGGGGSFSSPEWEQLSVDYFADSCVSGEPREIKTRPAAPPVATSAPTPVEISEPSMPAPPTG